jgi:hypothetical protein
MKFQLIKLVFLLLLFNNLNAQSSFSYKRQLSYKQCQHCSCKKSRSYKIISNNLTSVQMTCANEDINSSLMMKEMFQSGTSGGLFGGFNPPQEGCGNDCYHEFENVTDNVETVQITDCLSKSEKQKINDNKQNELNEQKSKEEQERLKKQKLLELAQNKDANIQELIKQADAYGDKNDFENCLALYEKICIQAKELNGFCKENRFSYSGYEDAVNNYGWFLILNKDYEKALETLNVFSEIDFSKTSFNHEDSIKLNQLKQNKYSLIIQNISHAILLLNKKEIFWEFIRFMDEYGRDKGFYSSLPNDYDTFKDKGIIISDIENIKFILKSIYKYEYSTAIISNNSSNTDKIWFEESVYRPEEIFRNVRDIVSYPSDSIHRILKCINNEWKFLNVDPNINLILVIDDNLYRVPYYSLQLISEGEYKLIVDKYLFYYFDKNGGLVVTNTLKTNISPKKEAKIINQAKLIRDKDLGIIPK